MVPYARLHCHAVALQLDLVCIVGPARGVVLQPCPVHGVGLVPGVVLQPDHADGLTVCTDPKLGLT